MFVSCAYPISSTDSGRVLSASSRAAIARRSAAVASRWPDCWESIVDGSPARNAGAGRRDEIVAVHDLNGLVPHGVRHGTKTWLDEDAIHSRSRRVWGA